MLIPIVGELITALGLILCTYFDKWPMEVAGVTEALFPGLAGAFIEPFEESNRFNKKIIKTTYQEVGLQCLWESSVTLPISQPKKSGRFGSG